MKFQPSDESYGLWPLPSPSSAASAAVGWLADDVAAAQAKSGLVSVDSSVYSQLDPRMTKAPNDLTVAYEQAIYFLAIAAQRADFENEGAANASLLAALGRVEAEKAAVSDHISTVCSTTGYFCPKRGAVDVLQNAVEDIEMSGLNAEDQSRLGFYLESNVRAVRVRQAVPVVLALGLGAAVGTWWYRTHRA